MKTWMLERTRDFIRRKSRALREDESRLSEDEARLRMAQEALDDLSPAWLLRKQCTLGGSSRTLRMDRRAREGLEFAEDSSLLPNLQRLNTRIARTGRGLAELSPIVVTCVQLRAELLTMIGRCAERRVSFTYEHAAGSVRRFTRHWKVA